MSTPKRARGERDYLKLRGNRWSLRFQYPPALRESACLYYDREDWPKEEERSLGTSDRREAEALAQRYILRHKELLLFHAARTDDEKSWGEFTSVWQMEPNTKKVLADGTVSVATEDTIIHMHPDGRVTHERNRRRTVIRFDENAVRNEPAFLEAKKAREELHKVVRRDVDAEMLTAYVEAAGLSKDDRALAERGLVRFKEVNGGRTIATSVRSDVTKLIAAEFEARGPNGGERIKKMIAYLRAAVNHNIRKSDAPLYKVNLFEGHDIATNGLRRPPYSEADLRTIKANRSAFRDEEWLLVTWHIASSVRPVGLDSIRSDEMTEEDEIDAHTGAVVAHHVTRSVMIESDKDNKRGGADYGQRRLPIPQAVLDAVNSEGKPLLPPRIVGPLFSTPLDQLLVAVNSKLFAIGVNTEDERDATGRTVKKGKSLYSGRHRARDRFRQIKCEEEMSRAIMGHARGRSDSHGSYGHGFTMFAMKKVIDGIRF
ncbi:hypothetical protein ABZT49_13775 [Methylobacterium sp. EM32]|uniref:hypothetical protein n=1 Tax=Methylobacterium sp. EM32 TaxID=3163481 RepID=UPI0033A0D643